MSIGDVVRVKTKLGYTHDGEIGLITGRTGDHYSDVALEVLC